MIGVWEKEYDLIYLFHGITSGEVFKTYDRIRDGEYNEKIGNKKVVGIAVIWDTEDNKGISKTHPFAYFAVVDKEGEGYENNER